MEARLTLDLMAEALAFDDGPSGEGVVAIADLDWSAARSKLRILEQPRLPAAVRAPRRAAGRRNARSRSSRGRRTLTPDEARRTVAEVVTEELGAYSSPATRRGESSKPLSEIGVDSLMAVELALALGAAARAPSSARRVGTSLPL